MNGFTQVTLSYQILPLGYTWLQKTIQFTDNLKSTKYVNQKYENFCWLVYYRFFKAPLYKTTIKIGSIISFYHSKMPFTSLLLSSLLVLMLKLPNNVHSESVALPQNSEWVH